MAVEDKGPPHGLGSSPSPMGAEAATGLSGCTLGDKPLAPLCACHLARTTGSCLSVERCVCTLPGACHEFPYYAPRGAAGRKKSTTCSAYLETLRERRASLASAWRWVLLCSSCAACTLVLCCGSPYCCGLWVQAAMCTRKEPQGVECV